MTKMEEVGGEWKRMKMREVWFRRREEECRVGGGEGMIEDDG